MRALPIYVYRNNSLGDCTNGGISSRFDKLLLVCDDGFVDIDAENPPENLVVVISRHFGNREYKHIEPYVKPTHLGWMHGGNVAYSSDSRFPSAYPLCIHDRQETQEQYDLSFD